MSQCGEWPPGERAERAAWFGGPTALVEASDDAPTAVIRLIEEWRGR
ncbi:MAG TPA: hypothetical protein VFS16_06210 [Acidimicrobiia bacterium]|nr:hypothetical protein [Acidimicrobiia bacterium]